VTTGRAQGRSRRLLLLPLILFAGLAGLFLHQLNSDRNPADLPSALVGRKAPEFALAPLDGLMRDGQPVPGLSRADLDQGVTLVNVWASWCVPCREEHPVLIELAKERQIRLVGLNYKDTPENARRFLGALGNPFAAVGADVSGRTGIDWGVYGVPETFVVGPGGAILYKHVGPLTAAALDGPIRSAITAARR
jgi:cytochrome c biogenesis protein CcmG/thiol:disulfide interchange protein DsbE